MKSLQGRFESESAGRSDRRAAALARICESPGKMSIKCGDGSAWWPSPVWGTRKQKTRLSLTGWLVLQAAQSGPKRVVALAVFLSALQVEEISTEPLM